MPTSWSYSKLSSYEKCPYQLVLGQQFKQQPNTAMERGTAIHKEMEDYLNDAGDLPPNFTYFHPYLMDIKIHRATAELQWGLNDDWTPCDEFKTAWGKCIIDACVVTPTSLFIVDFKTGKPNPIGHQDQAQIYAIAGHCYYPNIPTITTEFWYLDKNKITQQLFTRQDTDRYRTILNARVQRLINDDTLAPKPNKFICRWCNYNQHCEYRADE